MENKDLFNFSRRDFWLTALATELIALLIFPVLLNLNFFSFLPYSNTAIKLLFLLLLIILPFFAAFCLRLINKLTAKNFPLFFQISKYGVVGVLNTVLGASVFNILIFLTNISRGGIIVFFTIVAFIASITNGFFWSKFWVFQKNNLSKTKSEYIKAFGISSALTIINLLIIHIGVNIIGAPPGFDLKLWANIIFFITIPISFFGNFFGYKKLVFKN